MWKKLLDSEYFFLFENNLEIITIFVTNYVSIWRTQFSNECFLACIKDSNFGLEMNDHQLLEKGTQILTNPERLKSVRDKKEDDNVLVLTLTMSFGYPMKLKMKMKEGSKELFFSKITVPLLKTIQDLKASQRELRDELQKKNLEIEEYKCEGGEIALRFLKTIPFNDEKHILNHMEYSHQFGDEDISLCVVNKPVDVPEYRPIKAELVDIKQESPPQTKPQIKEEEPMNMKKEDDLEEGIKCEENLDRGNSDHARGDAPVPSPNRSRLRLRPATAGHELGKRKKLNL